MGSRQSDQLVGRAEELVVLERVLDDLDEGRPALLEVSGEPGIGKTRLLQELAARADERRLIVLAGSGSELETDLPFSVFVDAFDEYLRSRDARTFETLDDEARTELAQVFPALTGISGAPRTAPQHERYRSHRAVRALLEMLATRAPLVLVLDDVHWADSASVELLGALLRRPPQAPVAISVATRPRQVPERLAATLERAYRTGALTRLEPSRLTLGEARTLFDALAQDEVERLYRESGGNPFYLEQLARARARGGGGSDAGTARAAGVPQAVIAALAEELTLLAPATRLLLEGAAVAGDPFEPELAAAAAGVAEDDAMGAIDELLRADLVRATDVPRRFRFRHPLVRSAVYEATSPTWRLGAHERCAGALEARGASSSARAHHVERSAREGDLRAVALLALAGQESARLAPASAAHWFGEALRLLPATASPDERVQLLEVQAAALKASGQYAASHAVLVEALSLAPVEDGHSFVSLTRACAEAETLLGRPHQAGERLRSALDRVDADAAPEAVPLLLELAVNSFYSAQFEEMHAAAARALATAQRSGQRPLVAAALAVLGFSESLTGKAESAEAKRLEAVRLMDAMSDDELAGYVEGAVWLAGAQLYLDRYEEADRHASRALHVARATANGAVLLVATEVLGGVWRQRGKLADAAELLDGGIEAARLLDNKHALTWTLSGRSTIALPLGDLELALATAREAFELSRDAEATFHSAEAAAVLAAASLEAGEASHAVELLLAHAGGESLELIAGSPRAGYLELLTRSRIAAGDLDGAARAADAALASAGGSQLPMALAWASRAAAAVALERGAHEEAVARAETASAAADSAGAPVEAALARTVLGRAHAAAGRADEAVAELREAAARLDGLGCVRFRDAAERELGKLGHRTHRRTASPAGVGGIEALTGRELEIARLVVDRKTNPQIAAELYLSQKTVETHLRNIFRKLNVSSRVELARVVERVP